MIHHLKTWPQYFQRIQSGEKPFELRKNDRDFQVGDTLILQEWLPKEGHFSPNELMVEVTYVFIDSSGSFGLKEGYCVMGIKILEP